MLIKVDLFFYHRSENLNEKSSSAVSFGLIWGPPTNVQCFQNINCKVLLHYRNLEGYCGINKLFLCPKTHFVAWCGNLLKTKPVRCRYLCVCVCELHMRRNLKNEVPNSCRYNFRTNNCWNWLLIGHQLLNLP